MSFSPKPEAGIWSRWTEPPMVAVAIWPRPMEMVLVARRRAGTASF
jgi:hypothetical protein